jgi:hypothetical protein
MVSSLDFLHSQTMLGLLDTLQIAESEEAALFSKGHNKAYSFKTFERKKNKIVIERVFKEFNDRKTVFLEINLDNGSVKFPYPGALLHYISSTNDMGPLMPNDEIALQTGVSYFEQIIDNPFYASKFKVNTDEVGRLLTLQTIAETPAFNIQPEIIVQVQDYVPLELSLHKTVACMMLGLTAKETDDYDMVPKTYIDAMLKN